MNSVWLLTHAVSLARKSQEHAHLSELLAVRLACSILCIENKTYPLVGSRVTTGWLLQGRDLIVARGRPGTEKKSQIGRWKGLDNDVSDDQVRVSSENEFRPSLRTQQLGQCLLKPQTTMASWSLAARHHQRSGHGGQLVSSWWRSWWNPQRSSQLRGVYEYSS